MNNPQDIKDWEKDIIEKLAEIEHKRWADWQKYCHSKCDGGRTIEKTCFERWQKQIYTPYENLSEEDKHKDRDQVMRYWPIINSLLSQREQEIVGRIRGEIEKRKVKVSHADECLATKEGDSYCDCSDYISTLTRNWSIDEILSLPSLKIQDK